ncbi:MAG: hypothetical protein ABMA64_05670 [Myxococcota bacterium]
MRAMVIAAGIGLTGCPPPMPEEIPGPCESDRSALDVAPPDGAFGDLGDGDTLWCGNPPQGGAPYTPFRLRVRGPEAWEDGAEVLMTAADADGTELGWTQLTLGLTCANVGESAGSWVGSEAHLRYSGWGLDELDGMAATVTLSATALADPSVHVSRAFEVVLDTEPL